MRRLEHSLSKGVQGTHNDANGAVTLKVVNKCHKLEGISSIVNNTEGNASKYSRTNE